MPGKALRLKNGKSTHEQVVFGSPRAARASASFAGTLGPDRWTWHRAIRTEHAAIARLRLQLGATARALVEKTAGIRRHAFRFLRAAMWARDEGFEDHAHHVRCKDGAKPGNRTAAPLMTA
jgi:hypothetical protein